MNTSHSSCYTLLHVQNALLAERGLTKSASIAQKRVLVERTKYVTVHRELRVPVRSPVADQFRLYRHPIWQYEIAPSATVGIGYLLINPYTAIIRTTEMIEHQFKLPFLILRSKSISVLSGRFSIDGRYCVRDACSKPIER